MSSPHRDDFAACQALTLDALHALLDELRPGHSEQDIAALAEECTAARGFSGALRAPRVHIGGFTPRFWTRPSAERRLEHGSPLTIELSPSTDQAFGCAATSLTFGTDERPAVSSARETCRAVLGFASQWKCAGELLVYARSWTNNRRTDLATDASVGFRCFGPGEAPTIGSLLPYPLSARVAARMRRNQLVFLNPRRLSGVWVVRTAVRVERQWASFAEMLYVDGDTKEILGRSDLQEVGTRHAPSVC